MSEHEFVPWPKIVRPKGNNIVITEKIDGTNACIHIHEGVIAGIQSRKRFIKAGDDNFAFAHWVGNNEEDLLKLGDGHHFGEWAGPGIQGNPHKLEAKTFFLFNVDRPQETLPDCVGVVPTLYRGPCVGNIIDEIYSELWATSEAQGYKPEGIVVFYYDTKQRVKYTYANQDGKWVNENNPS